MSEQSPAAIQERRSVLSVAAIAEQLGVEESLVARVTKGRDRALRPIFFDGRPLYNRRAVIKIRVACRAALAGRGGPSGPRARKMPWFAGRLKALRLDRGFSQRELAIMTGSSQMRICKLERGTEPQAAELLALADAFGVSIDSLCREDGSQVEAPEDAPPQPA